MFWKYSCLVFQELFRVRQNASQPTTQALKQKRFSGIMAKCTPHEMNTMCMNFSARVELEYYGLAVTELKGFTINDLVLFRLNIEAAYRAISRWWISYKSIIAHVSLCLKFSLGHGHFASKLTGNAHRQNGEVERRGHKQRKQSLYVTSVLKAPIGRFPTCWQLRFLFCRHWFNNERKQSQSSENEERATHGNATLVRFNLCGAFMISCRGVSRNFALKTFEKTFQVPLEDSNSHFQHFFNFV